MPSQDKVQLNLCVDPGTSELFRSLAKKTGYGSRPSPFLSKLLEIYIGNMRALAIRLAKLYEEQPHIFAGREQRFYAREVISILSEIVSQSEGQQKKD